MSGKDVALTGDFRDKVFERMRESIGDLIDDDQMSALVQAALHDAFFKERRINKGFGSDEIKPPLILELALELYKEQMAEHVRVFMTDNKDEIIAMLERLFKDNGLDMIKQAVTDMIGFHFDNLKLNITNDLMDRLHR